mgnify:CR=1 FL=1
MPESNLKDSDLYNIPHHTPLALVIDRCHGFILLKNLATKIQTEMYSIAVEKEDKSPHMANEPQVAWCSPQQADIVMREILNNPTYNKATKDFMNSYEA